MSFLTVLFAFIPRKYLIGAAALVALLVGSWAMLAAHNHALKAQYFDKGAAFVRDSAVEATILRLAVQHKADSARAAESVRAARDSSSALASMSVRLQAAPRYTPRFERLPDTLPLHVDTSLVRVIVEATADTIPNVPRRAAILWFKADSTLGDALKANRRYVAANAGWSNAWSDEHAARIGADSLVAMYAERLRSQPAIAGSSHMHRIAYLALGVAAGFLVAKRVH